MCVRPRLLLAPLLAGLSFLLGCFGGRSAVQAEPILRVGLAVPFAPQAVPSAEWQSLAYEVNLTDDLRTLGYSLDRLEILDGADEGRVVATLHWETINQQLIYLPSTGTATVTVLPVWLHLAPGAAVPASLVHRFRFLRYDDTRVVTRTGARTAVDPTPLRVLAPPLKGEGLTAFEIGEATTHHFRSLILVDRATRSPQRWASDWCLLTAEGRLFTGTGKANTDYPGWGTNYYAVADGTVVEARDGLPDQACWPGKITDPVILANPAGNHVIVDIGQGHFAVYGHCQNQSVAVRVGDRVVAGQVLARMGNTGLSDCPHLHFQLSNGRDVFNAESVPYVIDRYAWLGRADVAALMGSRGAYVPLAAPVELARRSFDQGSVVGLGR